MEELKKKGHIKYWGVSISNEDEAAITLRNPNVDVIQFYANIAEPMFIQENFTVIRYKDSYYD